MSDSQLHPLYAVWHGQTHEGNALGVLKELTDFCYQGLIDANEKVTKSELDLESALTDKHKQGRMLRVPQP